MTWYLAIMLCTFNIYIGQTFNPEPVQFVEEPSSHTKVEMNTTITLFWRIEYEGCSSGDPGGCLLLSLDTFNGHRLYDFHHDIRDKNLLFDAATTITPAGPNSTSSNANLRVIMFIDEFVRNNVPFLYCKVVVSLGGRISQEHSIVNISVTNQTATAIPTTQPTPTSISELCSSAYVLYSSELCFGLSCFIQLLYTIAYYYG